MPQVNRYGRVIPYTHEMDDATMPCLAYGKLQGLLVLLTCSIQLSSYRQTHCRKRGLRGPSALSRWWTEAIKKALEVRALVALYPDLFRKYARS